LTNKYVTHTTLIKHFIELRTTADVRIYPFLPLEFLLFSFPPHHMDRPKVPMHHGSKKGYFVAFDALAAALRADGLTDKVHRGQDVLQRRLLPEARASHRAATPKAKAQFYNQSRDAEGDPAFDEHGLPLLDCNRGTNDVENSHKQIITTFGTWCTACSPSGATATTTARCPSTPMSLARRWRPSRCRPR
jgi:hypothetical protein